MTVSADTECISSVYFRFQLSTFLCGHLINQNSLLFSKVVHTCGSVLYNDLKLYCMYTNGDLHESICYVHNHTS